MDHASDFHRGEVTPNTAAGGADAQAPVLAKPLHFRIVFVDGQRCMEQDVFICREEEWHDYPKFHDTPWQSYRKHGVRFATYLIS